MASVKVVICLYIMAYYNMTLRTVFAESNGYYCMGTSKGNLYLKCVKTPCNGTICETRVDYEDVDGPDAVIDSAHKILVNLEMKNISIIHVLFINYVRYSADINNTIYRLTRPVIIKVQLSTLGELYKFRFIHFVNGGPKEEVISKDTSENYFGCDSRQINPTCGIQYYGLRDPVPFSEGFCCSCLSSVNVGRQPRPCHAAASNDMISENDFQPRGGQDCKNISTSPNHANPITYHESAHCFRYSDLWFNVYKIEKAKKFIPMKLDFFKKTYNNVYELERCYSTRKSLYMKNRTSDVNDERNISRDPLSFHYTIRGLNETVENDLNFKYILIPQEVPEEYRTELTESNSYEPNKFLVIDPSWMTGDGTECDKVGVKPKAFNYQPNRCYRPRGSCLGRQPIDLMRKMADSAVDTRVFVGDYVQGRVRYDGATEQLIAEDSQLSDDGMTATAVHDTVCMQGVVVISYDDNGAITNDRRVFLQISEIHSVFNNDDMRVAIRVYVTNFGLKTVEFFVNISDQNVGKNCDKQTVHPQQTIECHLNLECLANKCIAIMRLYTMDCIGLAVVAYRKFGVIRGCRCYCLWRARCECYGPYFGQTRVLSRSPLSQFEYNEAGFLGDALPCKAADEFATLVRDIVFGSIGLLVAFMAVTIALGLAKAASPYRSHWLWIVPSNYPSSKIDAYKELELKLCTVVRDEWGYYVHPITKSRNIRLFDRFREFFMNVVFFFNLPVTFWWYLRSADYSRVECDFSTESRPLRLNCSAFEEPHPDVLSSKAI